MRRDPQKLAPAGFNHACVRGESPAADQHFAQASLRHVFEHYPEGVALAESAMAHFGKAGAFGNLSNWLASTGPRSPTNALRFTPCGAAAHTAQALHMVSLIAAKSGRISHPPSASAGEACLFI
jgi:hypothetical protein